VPLRNDVLMLPTINFYDQPEPTPSVYGKISSLPSKERWVYTEVDEGSLEAQVVQKWKAKHGNQDLAEELPLLLATSESRLLDRPCPELLGSAVLHFGWQPRADERIGKAPWRRGLRLKAKQSRDFRQSSNPYQARICHSLSKRLFKSPRTRAPRTTLQDGKGHLYDKQLGTSSGRQGLRRREVQSPGMP